MKRHVVGNAFPAKLLGRLSVPIDHALDGFTILGGG
jgi:hypothetical protein